MAYIYLKNGERYLFDRCGDNIGELRLNSDDGYDVDTLLAYPVLILNNKGYITEQSCEGHPLPEFESKTEEEYIEIMKEDISFINKIIDTRKNVDGEECICFKIDLPTGAYIIFDDGIRLSSFPEGWRYIKENNSIRWDCELYSDPTDYYKKLIFAIDSLTVWAEQLEDITAVYLRRDEKTDK